MPTVAELFAVGLHFHQVGRFHEAEQVYRHILTAEPQHADSLHLLGVVAFQTNRLELAQANILRAIELRGNEPSFHSNLGNVYKAQGKLDDAIASYRRALELNPNLAEALNNLGAALQAQEKVNEAVACYRRAVELQPNHSGPQSNLGAALHDLGRYEEAVQCYRRALEINPLDAATHSNLGNTLRAQEDLERAAASYRRALELKPDYAVAYNNLGNVLQSLGRLDEAVACLKRALKLKPDYSEAHTNLGTAFAIERRFDDAFACYARALALNPDSVYAHFARSMLNLLLGDFERGWPEYEWRAKTDLATQRQFPRPVWDGTPIGGKIIFLYSEQGFGDTIQFVRYAAEIKKQHPHATVILESPRALLPLLSRCPFIDQLIGCGEPLPAFDLHAPLLSVPGIVKTSLGNIPAEIPYLFADRALVEGWRKRLERVPGIKIGINWRGRPLTRRRDLPLQSFKALAELPRVTLISLQKGTGREELIAAQAAGFPVIDLGDDFDEAGGAFMDTAAVMMNLDLVITSDTAIPHLAGALGVPVWLGLPFVPDWRWLVDRPDSPWYPTMRLFRQQKQGDWTKVFDEIAAALLQRIRH
jgi:tetratricopeptide (TPR) repeat protein